MSLFNKMFKKSAITTNTRDYILTDPCHYISLNIDNSPSSLLLHNKHFVYAANQKIAQILSSIPLHLYVATGNSKKMLTSHKSIDKIQQKRIQNLMKKELEVVEVLEHNVIDLLQHPYTNMSYIDFIVQLQSYLGICGNYLVELVKTNNKITALKPLLWEYVTVNVTKDVITDYTYNSSTGYVKTFKPEEVIHFVNYSTGSTIIGRGNLESCIEAAALMEYFDQYQIQLCKNYGFPGAHVKVGTGVGSEDERKKISEDFKRKYGGLNTGKPIVTFGDVEVKPLSISPKDMEYVSGRAWCKKVICAAFGVPEDLLSTEDSNRASSITAQKQLIEYTVLPILSKILEKFNTELVTTYDQNAYVWWDEQEVLSPDPIIQSTVISNYVTSGIMTVEEARSKLGLINEE